MQSIFFSSLCQKFEGFKETKASTEFAATEAYRFYVRKIKKNNFEHEGECQASPARGRDQKSTDFELHALRQISF